MMNGKRIEQINDIASLIQTGQMSADEGYAVTSIQNQKSRAWTIRFLYYSRNEARIVHSVRNVPPWRLLLIFAENEQQIQKEWRFV